MIEVTTEYQLKHDKLSRCRIYGLSIGGIPRAVSSPPTDAESEWNELPETLAPLTIDRDADPRECRFSHGTLRFLLYDTGGTSSTLIGSGIIGQVCQLYEGFYGVPWAEAAILFTGLIQEITQTEKAYEVTVRSPVTLADKTLFKASKMKLVGPMTSGDLSIIVTGAEDLQDEGFLLIEDERIYYTSKTDNGTGSWTINSLTRGLSGIVYGITSWGLAASHAAGIAVSELFVIGPAHPLDIMSGVMLQPTTYKYGVGMGAWVDFADLLIQKALVGDILMTVEVSTEENAKTWFERELLKPIGAYPYENNLGLTSVKIFRQPTATVATIEDGDCLRRAIWVGNFPKLVNAVYYLTDYNLNTQRFERSYVYRDTGLIELYGQEFPLVIEARAMRDALTNTEANILLRSIAYVARFGMELPRISTETIFQKNLLEIADDIACDFDHLINLSASAAGLTGPAEIIGMRHVLSTGRMEFDLLGHPPIFIALRESQAAYAITSTPETAVRNSYHAEVLFDTPLGYWRLDELSGTVAADSTGGGSDGEYVGDAGGVTLDQAGPLTDGTPCPRFDGISGRVVIPHTAALVLTNDMSVEFWMQFLALPSNYLALALKAPLSITSEEFGVWYDPFTSRLFMERSAWPQVKIAPSFTLGQWYHFVGTIEGTVGRLYINGVEAASYIASDSFGAVAVPAQPLRFGASLYGGGYSFLNGNMASCALYNYALSAARIAVHYDSR